MLAPVPYSPDLDVFTTPPTTPMTSEPPSEPIIRPSLSRSMSRPSSLHISKTTGDFKLDILLESQSPQSAPSDKSFAPATTPRFILTDGDGPQVTNGHPKSPPDNSGHDSHSRPRISTITTTDSTLKNRALLSSQESAASAPMLRSHPHSHSPMTSPCFVHSNLDKGASFSEWLKTSNGFPARVDVAPILRPKAADWPQAPPRHYRKLDNGQVIPIPYEDDKVENVFDASEYDYEDDEGSASLTKQLAETAVGVREMSKQLGALLESHTCLMR
jgi:NAD+ kinase